MSRNMYERCSAGVVASPTASALLFPVLRARILEVSQTDRDSRMRTGCPGAVGRARSKRGDFLEPTE